MSVGLLAIVDDVLTAALKASAKTAGVVIDDAAVTPQYVQGLTPARELPVVWRIALGSLFNKFVIIIPLALLLSAFAPWVLPFLLIIGGTYLCFEGAEKVTEWFGAHHASEAAEPRDERKLVFGAIRTDLILSTEIMLIALDSLDPDFGIWMTLGALVAIGLGMTVLVYGTVALLVKIDDIGLRLMKSPTRSVRRTGARIVASMPAVFRVISIVGTVAMLWVGGHLVIANLGRDVLDRAPPRPRVGDARDRGRRARRRLGGRHRDVGRLRAHPRSDHRRDHGRSVAAGQTEPISRRRALTSA